MRTNEERISAMHMRADILVEESQRRKMRIIQTASVFCCLMIVVTLASFMPRITETVNWKSIQWEMTGSIFSGSPALGYIVIAIIAFLLGVSVTIFCFRLRDSHNKKQTGTTP